MVTIEELMRIAKDNGASDVHITVGIPPKMRVAGALTDMDFPRFLPLQPQAERFPHSQTGGTRAAEVRG